ARNGVSGKPVDEATEIEVVLLSIPDASVVPTSFAKCSTAIAPSSSRYLLLRRREPDRLPAPAVGRRLRAELRQPPAVQAGVVVVTGCQPDHLAPATVGRRLGAHLRERPGVQAGVVVRALFERDGLAAPAVGRWLVPHLRQAALVH